MIPFNNHPHDPSSLPSYQVTLTFEEQVGEHGALSVVVPGDGTLKVLDAQPYGPDVRFRYVVVTRDAD